MSLRGAQRRGNLVQEAASAYKPTARDCHDQCAHWSRNDKWGSFLCHCEERSDAAISRRNYRVYTDLFVCTVCRFAVGGGTCASAACGGRSEQKGVAESRRLILKTEENIHCNRFSTCRKSPRRVIARSEATWQSNKKSFVFAGIHTIC